MRKIKGIPIWVVVLVCIVAVVMVTACVFETVKFPVEVEEPLSVVSYPALLNFYPNTTEPFNITVENVASVNYLVSLAFSLNDTTYQQAYVTFSDETYTVLPSLNELTAWIYVAADAPAKALELTVELNRVSEVEPTFSHTFTWTNETQSIVNGTLVMKLNFRLTEKNLLITAQINKTELDYNTWLGIIFDNEFDGFHVDDHGYVFNAENEYYPPNYTMLTQEWWLIASGHAPFSSPYHNCTFSNSTGYTFHIKFPKSVIPEKAPRDNLWQHVLRIHVDFSGSSWRPDNWHWASVSAEFSFENFPFGVPS